jgi:carboxymethylenebutenolidase
MTALLEITLAAGDGAPATPAVALLPPGAARGVVVIHEIFGRAPEIDRVVERFAAAGYAAVAPDLFHRGKLACLRDVFLQVQKTGDGVAVRQGRNARAWLCARTGINPSHVGLIGFSFGGGYALAAGDGWAAVSENYGHLPKEDAMRGIGPTIACYGARDRTTKRVPEQLRQRLAAIRQTDAEVHMFDAGHSFLTDGRLHLIHKIMPMGAGDCPEARAQGWERIFAFFDRHLGLTSAEGARSLAENGKSGHS